MVYFKAIKAEKHLWTCFWERNDLEVPLTTHIGRHSIKLWFSSRSERGEISFAASPFSMNSWKHYQSFVLKNHELKHRLALLSLIHSHFLSIINSFSITPPHLSIEAGFSIPPFLFSPSPTQFLLPHFSPFASVPLPLHPLVYPKKRVSYGAYMGLAWLSMQHDVKIIRMVIAS